MKKHLRVLFSLGVLAFMATGIRADVSLPSVLGSRMVLQRDVFVPVWGWAAPGEAVQVLFNDQVKKTTAGSEGGWIVQLDPMKAGGPFSLTVRGKNEIVLNDVLVGEVWICSGQSNMGMAVNGCLNADQEIASSQDDQLRLYQVKNVVADTPQSNCEGIWEPATPGRVASFTAVGYFFGRDLRKELGVPVGLIMTAWGGTPAESWISAEKLQSDTDFHPIQDRFKDAVANYPAAKAEFDKTLAEWEKKAEEAKAKGQEAPGRPWPPIGPGHHWTPSGLFNAMVHPLIPFGVAGAIWYQGESNADRAFQYRELLPALISDWRERWGQERFDFGVVQLANFTDYDPDPSHESAWAELREAQSMTAATVQDVGQAVIIDIGDAKDIHPKNKQDVGRRLALWALAKRYGRHDEYSGPAFKSMKVKKDRIRLRFTHASGLRNTGDKLEGFAVAGQDHIFKWADAQIKGKSVWVSSPDVSAPVAVRYGWANNPRCTLVNKQGLPASPFRTDEWPGVTFDKR